MTKEAAIYEFFNGFGVRAYPATAVPEDAVFPWITYELVTGNWRHGEINITVNVWCYTKDESEPTAIVRRLEKAITGDAQCIVKCDGGFIWLKQGNPWCQHLQDTDTNIKRRYLNVTAEYMTQ